MAKNTTSWGTIMRVSKNPNDIYILTIVISSGLSSKRIILSPFTKEFRGEGHSYESLIFSEVAYGRQFIKSQSSKPYLNN